MTQPRPITHLLMLQSSPMDVPAPIAMLDPSWALREQVVTASRYLRVWVWDREGHVGGVEVRTGICV
jgi:hypothetical protein